MRLMLKSLRVAMFALSFGPLQGQI